MFKVSKRVIATIGSVLLIAAPIRFVFGYTPDSGYNEGMWPAISVSVDTTNFNGNLSSLDNTAQKAFDTLDDLVAGGGTITIGSTPITGGADTQILYNDGGFVGSSATFVFNESQSGLTPSTSSVAINPSSAGSNSAYLWIGTADSVVWHVRPTGVVHSDDFPLYFGASRVWDMTYDVAGGTNNLLIEHNSGSGVIDFRERTKINKAPTGATLATASLSVNPASAGSNDFLFAVGVGGTAVFSVDVEGDVSARNLTSSTLTSGRVPVASTNGLLVDDADLTFSTDTLSATKVAMSSLTSGRVPFASTNGLLIDDSDFTFATDTLTVTKIAATTFTGNVTISTKNIVTDTTTGTQIATGSTQKLGFLGATPRVQDGATIDPNVSLSNFGFKAAGTAYTLTTSGTVTFSGTVALSGSTSLSGNSAVLTFTDNTLGDDDWTETVDADDWTLDNTTVSGTSMKISGATGNVALQGALTSTGNDLGWKVVDQTDNQACTTGCTSACVVGLENATGAAITGVVSCNATTADLCVCAGAS